MDHLAIMNKKWGMLEKILSGEKTIESRWYKSKRSPWGKINLGELVYFKNSGEPVILVSRVSEINQISDLTPDKVERIIQEHGKEIGISVEKRGWYINLFKDKGFCVLIYLEEPKLIEPFHIDKSKAGFCPQSAWLTIESINQIRK